jgi:hypothetical protein
LDLIRAKDNGGLIYPSKFVRTVCLFAEQSFLELSGRDPLTNVTVRKLVDHFNELPFLYRALLAELPEKEHLLHSVDQDRVAGICELISRAYFTTRLWQACRVFMETSKGVSIRNSYQRNAIYSESKAVFIQGDSDMREVELE